MADSLNAARHAAKYLASVACLRRDDVKYQRWCDRLQSIDPRSDPRNDPSTKLMNAARKASEEGQFDEACREAEQVLGDVKTRKMQGRAADEIMWMYMRILLTCDAHEKVVAFTLELDKEPAAPFFCSVTIQPPSKLILYISDSKIRLDGIARSFYKAGKGPMILPIVDRTIKFMYEQPSDVLFKTDEASPNMIEYASAKVRAWPDLARYKYLYERKRNQAKRLCEQTFTIIHEAEQGFRRTYSWYAMIRGSCSMFLAQMVFEDASSGSSVETSSAKQRLERLAMMAQKTLASLDVNAARSCSLRVKSFDKIYPALLYGRILREHSDPSSCANEDWKEWFREPLRYACNLLTDDTSPNDACGLTMLGLILLIGADETNAQAALSLLLRAQRSTLLGLDSSRGSKDLCENGPCERHVLRPLDETIDKAMTGFKPLQLPSCPGPSRCGSCPKAPKPVYQSLFYCSICTDGVFCGDCVSNRDRDRVCQPHHPLLHVWPVSEEVMNSAAAWVSRPPENGIGLPVAMPILKLAWIDQIKTSWGLSS